METIEASKALETLQAAKVDTTLRICRRAVAGETVLQQGDIYLHAVPKGWPRGKLRGTKQIALGTSVGSRHYAEGVGIEVYEGVKLPDGYTLPANARLQDVLGPVIVGDGGVLSVPHPEHAHHRAPTDSCDWQVTYQFDMTTQRRVAD